jgi:DNA-binding MarR family transcriptional regulator
MNSNPSHTGASHTTTSPALAIRPNIGLERLLDLWRVFHAIDAEFPLQYIICLTEIGRDEGLSLTTLAERTNLSLSTISRIVGALSDYRQNGQPFGLVDIQISKTERRRKELALTDKGKLILNNATKIISTP